MRLLQCLHFSTLTRGEMGAIASSKTLPDTQINPVYAVWGKRSG